MTAPAQAVSALRLRYIVTICSGSFLLFLVQPMIARMALPRLGGAPAVWNSAMLVYQALLLAGYGYAHWLGRFAVRRQALIHLAFFALAALMLPIGLSGASPPANASPAFWVPWLLLSSIGPLFLVVSAQAPLMQRWFAQSGGGDPYPLYAASNLGSFGGLLAYPLIVEPLLPIAGQRWLWSAGYALVMLFVLVCALALPRGGRTCAVSPDSTRGVILAYEHPLILHIASGALSPAPADLPVEQRPTSVCFQDDDTYFVGHDGGAITRHHAIGGAQTGAWFAHTDEVCALVWHDGHLWSASRDGTILQWGPLG